MYTKSTLAANGSSSYLIINGSCDILVKGLTAGSIKLQAIFPEDTTPIDIPDGSFTADVFKTIFISEDQVKVRLTGVSNNAGVIVRLARGPKN